MARASAASRETNRPSGGSSPVSASGPARRAPAHLGHCRAGPAEQFRPTGGCVMEFSGDSAAMDKQPEPTSARRPATATSAAGQIKNPTCSAALFLPAWRPAPSRPALPCGTSYRTELCISGNRGQPAWRTAGHVPLSSRYPHRGALITTPERLVLARCGDEHDIVQFLAAGQDGDQHFCLRPPPHQACCATAPLPGHHPVNSPRAPPRP